MRFLCASLALGVGLLGLIPESAQAGPRRCVAGGYGYAPMPYGSAPAPYGYAPAPYGYAPMQQYGSAAMPYGSAPAPSGYYQAPLHPAYYWTASSGYYTPGWAYIRPAWAYGSPGYGPQPAAPYPSFYPPTTTLPPAGKTDAPVPATTVDVAASDDKFEPATITIAPGTTIRWTNKGQHKHTVTAANASWDSGDLAPGQSYSATFTRAGNYEYYCRHHKDMKGTIVVK